MDTNALVIALVLIAIVISILSLFFKKGDRIKVLKVAIFFFGFLISLPIVLLCLDYIIPDSFAWLRWIVGIVGYILILNFFGSRMSNLVDQPKSTECEPDTPPNADKPHG